MTETDRTDDRTAGGVPSSGRTRPAGEDTTDEAFARTVERQTSSDHAAQALFERERDGAASDTEAAKAYGGVRVRDRSG